MRRFFLVITAFMMTLGVAFAQDLGSATSTYNQGAEALTMGDKISALKYFKDALKLGQTLGEPAKELVQNCKTAIVNTTKSIGIEAANAKNYDESISKLVEAEKLAQEYGLSDVVKECQDILFQVSLSQEIDQANAMFKQKNYQEASKLYQDILLKDSTNSSASIRVVQTLCELGKIDEAKGFLKLAQKNGQGKNATKVIGNSLLKNAVACLQKGKYEEAITFALSSNEVIANPKVYFIAGQAAQKMQKTDDAIKYFISYLEAAPKAKDAGKIALTIGALYQGKANKVKAIEYYKKAVALGIKDAQKYIDALSK